MRAEADYGVESTRPVSDPHQASIDDRPVGTWRAVIQEKTYYLHVGTGNIVGQSNWMELVLVNPGVELSRLRSTSCCGRVQPQWFAAV
jgi:hypothetical protein